MGWVVALVCARKRDSILRFLIDGELMCKENRVISFWISEMLS